ncbi:proline dehydrogenase [Diatrype stigma]|uniref:Proline dehydrogenase n=1 Tax=Diatrype stigma TaxID=117547 RepID=A0AAN9V132_9PEZI
MSSSPPTSPSPSQSQPQATALKDSPSPLAVLPLPTILRTLLSTTVSSSPWLLPPSLKIMSAMAHSDAALLNPDRNPLLRHLLKKTFYAQFCAGENAAEVRRTVLGLKAIGFHGVIMGYAREVVLTQAQQDALAAGGGASSSAEVEAECVRHEVEPWKQGNLETLRVAQPGPGGDFVALKFTGAGRQALYALKNRLPPPPALAAAIDEICALARAKDVPLLFDAEQDAVQPAIDDWTMHYQRKYNRNNTQEGQGPGQGRALIYGTYQAYLKSTPATLASHLAAASREGFTLGVKLVRGAYLGSDPRHIIHDTKEDTDAAYDAVASSLIRRRWGPVLRCPPQDAGATFPPVSVVLGSHNLASVRKAQALRASPEAAPGTELAIAQLMGMADDVSCDLLAANRACVAQAQAQQQKSSSEKTKDAAAAAAAGSSSSSSSTRVGAAAAAAPAITKAYKYIVWGSTKECMAYLLRRAHENKDAVSRTRSARDAMWGELKRRVKGVFGVAA